MPSIDGFELPIEIVDELQRIVDRSNETALLLFARNFPELKKGFRDRKGGVPIIRQRLRGQVVVAGALETDLRCFLASQSLDASFIAVLSSAALFLFLEQYLNVFGRVRFLTSMLLDEREDVRHTAITALREGLHKKDGDPAVARLELRDGLAPFLKRLEESSLYDIPEAAEVRSVDESPAESAGERRRQGRNVAEGLRAAEKEQRRLQRHAEHMEKRFREAEEQVRKLKQQVEQDRKRCENLSRERNQAMAEKAAALAQLEGEVEARVQAALSARFRAWLTMAEQTEAIAVKSGSGLLERAAAALTRQRDVDRKSGNIRLLRERFTQVETMLGEIRQAAAEALSPLPELRLLERELAAERERLGKALGENNVLSPVVHVLLARIGASSQPEDLLRIQRLLGELETQEALSAGEIVKLHAACNAALGKLYDANLAAGRPRRPAADPLMRLQESAAQGLPFALLVDGHNVLFGLPHIYGTLYDANGLPGPRAREALLSAVANLTGEKGRGRSWVFFDGETQDERPYSFAVREVYSGGGKATVRDRADQAILDYLDRVVRKDGFTVIVTDDAELGRAARVRGAAVASLAAFASLVIGVSAERKGRRSPS